MSTAKDISTAPTDGTCILILTHTYGFDREAYRMVRNGLKWVECRFHDGKWREWCGNPKTQSTAQIDPIAWVERPEVNLENF